MIVILGGGESGIGAALLAKAKGLPCIVSDNGTLDTASKAALIGADIPFEEGGHTMATVLAATLVIKSPGIPPKVPAVLAALEAGIPVIDELEFAFAYVQGRTICITGSNGKTTTTLLIYHILAEAGFSVGLGGNIGKSLAGQLAAGLQPDWWVLETSSFQLDGWRTFRPDIALVLNITPDHLDRYGSMEPYADSKLSISRHQKSTDTLIYFKDGGWIERKLNERTPPSRLLAFTLPYSQDQAAWATTEALHFLVGADHTIINLAHLPLKGLHNQLNMLAAGLALLSAGVSSVALEWGLHSFINAPHRLELVAVINQVSFINDSKATNPDSVRYALEAMQNPVVWIAGGKDKGNDYTPLEELVRNRVKALICLTKYPEPLLAAFQTIVPNIQVTESMADAIQIACKLAAPGYTVLLSPACASFDLFKNYEDRGDQFRTEVQALAK